MNRTVLKIALAAVLLLSLLLFPACEKEPEAGPAEAPTDAQTFRSMRITRGRICRTISNSSRTMVSTPRRSF